MESSEQDEAQAPNLRCCVPGAVCSCHDARQIKAEPIYMVLCHPVPQTVHYHLPDDRMVAVECVAAAAVVVVLS